MAHSLSIQPIISRARLRVSKIDMEFICQRHIAPVGRLSGPREAGSRTYSYKWLSQLTALPSGVLATLQRLQRGRTYKDENARSGGGYRRWRRRRQHAVSPDEERLV